MKTALSAHSRQLFGLCALAAACSGGGSGSDGAGGTGNGAGGGDTASAGSGGLAGTPSSGGSFTNGGGGVGEAGAGGTGGVNAQPIPFDLVAGGTAVDIFVDSADDGAVIRAVSDLQADVLRVSGMKPQVKNSTAGLSKRAILVGTLGKSPVIDALVKAGKLDVDRVQGKWEAFAVQAVDSPVDGVDSALVIAGSDRRGSIYGVYDISEAIGVSPWYWWADVTPEHKDTVTVDGAARQAGEPSIKYRGIFINDEENFAAWSAGKIDPGKRVGPETYKKLFELLLRLKANYLWPAMHNYSAYFNQYPENARNADAYGIVMGSSHAEMLLRNNPKEWPAWATAHVSNGVTPTYDYSAYPSVVRGFWDARVQTNGKYENSYSVGMRGEGDTPMISVKATTMPEKVALLQTIIGDQRDILTQRVPAALGPTLQIFTPYKEVLDLYNAGLQVPDDVSLLWPEDNHGYVRQLSSDAERQRSGGSGVYYHLSYWGPPHQSYLWINSTPLTLMREELRKAYDTGASRLLIVNVGDLKPAEIGLEFAMRFARRPDDYGETNVEDFVTQLASRDFSSSQAQEIADIVMGYFQLNIARRPEFMTKGIYDLVDYGDEAHRRLTELAGLLTRAEAVSQKLPADRVDAFYEMVLFPLRASKLTLEKYVNADAADLYAAQGRRKSVTKYRDAATAAFDAIATELAYYNTQLASGKWNKIMNPYNAIMPMIEGLPTLAAVPAAATGNPMGVVVERQTQEASSASLYFSSYTQDTRFIDIFTKADAGFKWTATPSASWIKIDKSSGTLTDEQRLHVSLDWATVPADNPTGTITISGPSSTKTINVKVSNPASPTRDDLQGYVEANGFVAIEAEHFTSSTSRGNAQWRVQTGLGRNGDSVKVFPDLSPSVTAQFATTSPSLDYQIYFFSTGKFPVTLYRVPTLNQSGSCRIALAMDGEAEQIVTGVHSVNEAAWRTTLLEHIEKLTTTLDVTTAGYHTLHLYKVDPSMVVDRIVIDTGGAQDSYLGPPESYRH